MPPRARVLVVEDEYYIAEDLVRALRAANVDVVGPLGNAEAALDAATRETFDAAVLDINLRGEMVFKVAAVLRKRDIPFGFATGYDKAALPAEFQHVPRWEKPVDTRELIEQIVALAEKA